MDTARQGENNPFVPFLDRCVNDDDNFLWNDCVSDRVISNLFDVRKNSWQIEVMKVTWKTESGTGSIQINPFQCFQKRYYINMFYRCDWRFWDKELDNQVFKVARKNVIFELRDMFFILPSFSPGVNPGLFEKGQNRKQKSGEEPEVHKKVNIIYWILILICKRILQERELEWNVCLPISLFSLFSAFLFLSCPKA